MSEDFFANSLVEDVAQDHAEQVQKLSTKEAERILKVYKRVRTDLRDRLDYVQPGTFTNQRMMSTLAQVEAALNALKRDLKSDMSSSAEDVAGNSVEDLIREIEKFEKQFMGASVPINLDAAVIASDVKNLLVSRMESSLATYSEFIRNKMAQGLTEAVIAQDSYTEVVRKVGLTFMGEEWKAQQIVRTELHNVYSMGKIEGMRDLRDRQMPDMMKGLFHPMDKRTGADSKKAARLNLVVDVDDYFEYKWNGETRRFFQPPDRPNDRAILIPVRTSWTSR